MLCYLIKQVILCILIIFRESTFFLLSSKVDYFIIMTEDVQMSYTCKNSFKCFQMLPRLE